MPRPLPTGTRIRLRRVERGLTQVALAKDAGISPSYLNLIEHDRRRIGGKLLADIARLLRTSPTQLSEGAEAGMVEALRDAASRQPETGAEAARAYELADAFPGWAHLIAEQGRRVTAQERALAAMSDRMAYDPVLSGWVHEVLTSVTAIRSTSAILVGEEALDPEWQTRFHRNLYEDSQRLADTAQSLAAHLTEAETPRDGVTPPQEALETWLAECGFHIKALEGGAVDLDTFLASAEAPPDLAREAARPVLQRYLEDAGELPLKQLAAHVAQVGPDPYRLAAETGVPLARAMRRLASLPPDLAGGPIGLAICDGSGTLTQRKQIDGFNLPRFGAACPLWPLYQVLATPTRPLCQRVTPMPHVMQPLIAWAVCDTHQPAGFDGPVLAEATMLVMPLDLVGEAAPATSPIIAGTTCRICTAAACPARREPSILPDVETQL